MPAAIDATGQKYGRLIALRADTSYTPRRWIFRCDCGAEVTKILGHVRNGGVLSCGCLRKDTTAALRSRDFTGMTVGRLTVLGLAPERHSHNRIAWLCRCACGADTTRNAHALGKKNPTLSCGCLQKEIAAKLRRAAKQENPISTTKVYRAEVRKKRRAKPEVAMAERMSRMLCWALAGVNAVKSGATFTALGYSPAALKEHLEKQFVDGMSWDNRAEWEIDHITPISSAQTPEDVLALNQLWNLRPLWSGLNNAKKNKRDFLI